MASNKRRRHTPDQIIRKLAEGNKLLASGQAPSTRWGGLLHDQVTVSVTRPDWPVWS